MKHLHFAPQRERRYPVLTAIDMALYWLLNLSAVVLTAFALKMLFALALEHPSVQLIWNRIGL